MDTLMDHTRNALAEAEKMIAVIANAEMKVDTFCNQFTQYQIPNTSAYLFRDDKIDALQKYLQAAIDYIPENRTTIITNLSLTVLRLKAAPTKDDKDRVVNEITRRLPDVKKWFKEIRAEADEIVRRLHMLYTDY